MNDLPLSDSDDSDILLPALYLALEAKIRESEPISRTGQIAPGARQRPYKRRKYVNRGIALGNANIVRDYLGTPDAPPVYDEAAFRQRFRMSRRLFDKLCVDIPAHNPRFRQQPDALGRETSTTAQKLTAVLKVLAYGVTPDMVRAYAIPAAFPSSMVAKLYLRWMITFGCRQLLRCPM